MLKKAAFIAGLFSSSLAFALQPLTPTGTDVVQLHLPNHQIKQIRLQRVSLSPSARLLLSHRANHLLLNSAILSTQAAAFIGMNDEPVLDQGNWGTCATFATTGVINALYGLQNNQRISQLCNLELGKTLDNPKGTDGGWNGSSGDIILHQIAQYGYIPLSYQNSKGCGGLKTYPVKDGVHNGSPMPIKQFTGNSVTILTPKNWNVFFEANDGDLMTPDQANEVIKEIKSSIDRNHRVLFGFLLAENVDEVGAAGKYNGIAQDTWVMTSRITKDLANDNNIGGHEIIIDGYDDQACATYDEDHKTKTQCGLFRVRNSWGTEPGYQGDYYMSYDYFKVMADEVYEIKL